MGKKQSSSLRTLVIALTAVIAVIGVAAYMTYFGINSNAAVSVCKTGYFCKTNAQCGPGRCVMMRGKSRVAGRWIPELPYGRCTCNNPVVPPPIR